MAKVLGLEGDDQADRLVHGGIDKAIYAYPIEHYEFWAQKLKRSDLQMGQFGENLIVEGMTEDDVHIGDVFRVGSAILKVTQPRMPCFKLGLKMASLTFPQHFLESGRVGYYLRVLQEGDVGTGDGIECLSRDVEQITIRQVMSAGGDIVAMFEGDHAE
jgi:MOSC domain-containing protein YiiM